jgi:radical SAM protein with 4Fe4S-binding SPASM domain
MQALLDGLGWVPRTCVWEITRACNLRCGHCGSMAGNPRRDELSEAECQGVIEELTALGNQHITFSGGEPTLRSDWPELARFAADRGIAVNLVTNGQTDAARLAAAARGAALTNVAVSLDGLEGTHDALRAPGAFRRATAAIQALSMAGLWVDVMVTVNQKNLSELAELHGTVARLGAKRLRVQLGKPIGNQTHRPDLTLAPRQLLELLPMLGRLNNKQHQLPIHLGDSVGFFSAEERRLRGEHCAQGHWTGCYAGCQAIGIQSDGGIKGCLSLQPRAGEADPFIEGNVRQQSLRDIWFGEGRFAYNRAPAHELDGACGTCSHRTICRGGAKCVAYAYTGSMTRDPMCYLAASRHAPRAAERIWPTAAAALLLGMAVPGCDGESTSDPGNHGGASGSAGDSSLGGMTATGGTTSSPGTGGSAQGGSATGGAAQGGTSVGGSTTQGTGGIDCQGVCCMCDYGIIPPEKYAACCGG